MKLFSSLKMKYKLLAAVFLPCLILMLFMVHFLYKEYTQVQNIVYASEIIRISEALGLFIDAIEEEKGEAIAMIARKEGGDLERLAKFRQATESYSEQLRELTSKSEAVIDEVYVRDNFAKLFQRWEIFNAKRSQLELKKASIDDINSAYVDIENTATEDLSWLIRQDYYADTARLMGILNGLIRTRVQIAKIRELGFLAFINNSIDFTQYINFVKAIGARDGFLIVSRVGIMPHENELFKKIYNDAWLMDSNKMADILIKQGMNGNFDVDPQKWWDAETQVIASLQEVSNKIIEHSQEGIGEMVRSEYIYLFLLAGLILLVFAATFFFVMKLLRQLTGKLQEEIEVLSTSAQEILHSITQASSATAETAASVAETTTTVEELKQTAQVSTDKAKNVTDVSDNALQFLNTSEKSLAATLEGMNKIQDGMGTISTSIIKLSEHSQAIGEIIETVNDLAEQSHILAVNAAIEAAKAGDQGRGFTVVAGEVRSMAEQSKQATVQVRKILNDIQNSTGAAVMATEQGSKAVTNGMNQSNETTDAIHSITSGISKVVEAAQQISISSQQQLTGVEQVTIAMTNIKEATNQQVEHMRQIETGVQGLNAVGQSLRQLVQEFKI